MKRATSAPLLDEIGYDEIDGKSRSSKKESKKFDFAIVCSEKF